MKIKVNCVMLNALAMAAIAGMPFATHAADGTINFTGTILDSACKIDTSSAPLTINLGQIPKSSFTAVGDVAAATRFTINLSSCPTAITSASVKFDGTADPTNSTILALKSGETAQGVGVALYEEDGVTAIPLATQSKPFTLDTATGSSNALTFVAKYKATQKSVVAGTANATTDLTITYQ